MKLYKVREAADILRISQSRLYEMVSEREIPCRRLANGSGKILFSQADLDWFLEISRQPAETQKVSQYGY